MSVRRTAVFRTMPRSPDPFSIYWIAAIRPPSRVLMMWRRVEAMCRPFRSPLCERSHTAGAGPRSCQRELRKAVEEVAAPYAQEDVGLPTHRVARDVCRASRSWYRHPFDRVVVGRGGSTDRLRLRGSIMRRTPRACGRRLPGVAPSGAAVRR